MKSYRFSLRWFFIDSFFDMRDMKTKTTPMCSLRQLCLEDLFFDLERSISKSDLGSGHDFSRSIFISSEAA